MTHRAYDVAGAIVALVLAACSSAPKKPEPVAPVDSSSTETQILSGSAPRANRTPMDPASLARHVAETLDAIGEYGYRGFALSRADAQARKALPIGLAQGATMTRPVRKGELITLADAMPDERLKIVEVRRAQDAMIAALHGAVDLERELQLACDLFAVFHRDEGVGRGLRCPGQIDGDAQQATGGAFDLHQVVSQSGDGF